MYLENHIILTLIIISANAGSGYFPQTQTKRKTHRTNKQKTWLTGSITQAIFETKDDFAASPQQDSDVSWEWNNFYALK